MRLASILSECARNIARGTAHAVAMATAVLLAGTLLGGYEATNVIALENEAVTRIGAYADTKTIMGSNNVIDGDVCDRLSMQGDGAPDASGAMRIGPQVTPASTPGKDLSSYEVTPGMLSILTATDPDARRDASGIWVSTEVADDFGLAAGGRMETTAGPVDVAGVFDWPNDGRDTRFVYALLIPVSVSAEPFSECWAKRWPADDTVDQLLYSTVIASDDSSDPAGVMAVNKGFDAHYDAQSGYLNRMTRWMPYAALAAGLVLGVVAVRRRRLEYAGALHSGQSKGAQLLGIAIETGVWAGLGAVCSCSLLAAYCVRASRSDPWAVFAAAARAPAALAAGALVAAVLAGLTIRESQLFRFFKHR